ncbi:hypothetical protein [Pseudomonas sp. Au-Pse12]|uniref:hypothetical protein n=1 Tax=Pseudomonas sp. Au-Pse12 TaxID=2906459 RepID=UPI001E4E1966|nr:hypothetical protein [Pseudomonas sp. Au-Pse12]MCE4058343.1 hypothetical protein [Pseudomonas sp. Au-Pse12]
MQDFDSFDDIDGYLSKETLPNLDHWKAVMEFTVEQAALLLAMIDPFDCETLAQAKRLNLSRWKKSHGHALGIVSAIRQGLISPVICMGYVEVEGTDWNGNISVSRELQVVRPSQREAEISMAETIITRASLMSWVSNANVQVTRPPRPVTSQLSDPQPPKPITVVQSQTVLALPNFSHKSEGLEFVEEAIKHFWSTYDEDDPSTAPRRDQIIEYLKSKGASGRESEAVDLILRPKNMRTAHLRNRKVLTREDQ